MPAPVRTTMCFFIKQTYNFCFADIKAVLRLFKNAHPIIANKSKGHIEMMPMKISPIKLNPFLKASAVGPELVGEVQIPPDLMRFSMI